VPGIGGKGLNFPKIPRLKVGMDYVPSDYFPAFLDKGERVLTAEENARYNPSLNGLVAPGLNSNNQSINVDEKGLSFSETVNAFKQALKESELGAVMVQIGDDEVMRVVDRVTEERDFRYKR